MPTPTVITDLSQTAASNYPAGTDSPSVLDDVQRAHAAFIALLRDGKGQTTIKTLAGGSTTDIGGENSLAVEVTGTPTITSLGTNYNGTRFVRFTGASVLTHNATLINLPGAANITTVAGDSMIAVPNSTGNGWNVLSYQRISGLALVSPTDYLNTTRIDVASATTVDLTANAPSTRHINITGTTTITGFTVAAGQAYFVRFNAALVLTNGAAIVTQTGANITTAAGDTCMIRATAADTVEIISYTGPATDAQPGRVELATTAEIQTGTDPARAITPAGLTGAFQGAFQSLAASGYQKLPGGLIIQWGTTAASNSGTVTFPMAFPNNCFSVAFGANNSSASFMCLNGAPSTTGFNWLANLSLNASRWIAVGN